MTDDLVGLERWPGYERQSWAERFAELDRQTSTRCRTLQNAIISMSAQHAARIEALEAEKALFRQVFEHLDRRKRDAPGHNHEVPGVWDDDPSNGLEAGTLCEWCALWSEVRAALTPEAPHAD